MFSSYIGGYMNELLLILNFPNFFSWIPPIASTQWLFGYLPLAHFQLIFIAVLSFVVQFAAAGSFLWQVLLTFRGQTIYELKRNINIYRQNWMTNVYNIFGPFGFINFLVSLPIALPGDGITEHAQDGDQKKHAAKVSEYFTGKLSNKTEYSGIPSLNSCPLHALKTNTTVRFRCMVQDMYDPEFYLGWYEVKDRKTGATRMVSGKYRDLVDTKPGEDIIMASNKNVTLDRQTLYCVPVPGENAWVKEIYSNQCKSVQNASSSSGGQNRTKRSLDDETEDAMEVVAENGNVTTESSEKGKLQKSTDSMEQGAGDQANGNAIPKGSASASGPNLNFPLAGEKGPACIVKIYEDQGFKVNDVVEFIGILSNDPFMANFPDDKEKRSMEDHLMEGCEDDNDARRPPPSLVPRLHVLSSKKLSHENPLVNSEISQQATQSAEIERIVNEAAEVRGQLLDILTYALFGDSLSAEYLLCHLVSTVYARQDVMALGKYAMNLSGCPKRKFTQYLYDVIQQLVTKSHVFRLTIKNLNEGVFMPAKDYNENRMKTGMLQLSDNTHLILDETAMEAGHLDVGGVKNLTALGNIIKWQKLEYDFNFHRQDFPTNLPVLVLSEGKSLIQCDGLVRLQPKEVPDDLTQHYANLGSKITPEVLTKLRSYLTIMRQLSYDLPDDISQKVQEDFIEMRKQDPKNMTGDDFHDLLTLSRLLSLSCGKTALCVDLWQRAKMMEKERKRRLDPPTTTAPNA